MNQMLTESYKEEEIKKALNSIGATKAPGPDGFQAIFFQKYWHIVRCEPTDSKKYWNTASTKRKVILSQEAHQEVHQYRLIFCGVKWNTRESLYPNARLASRGSIESIVMIVFYLGKQLKKEQKLLKRSSKNMKSVQGNASITEKLRNLPSYTWKSIWAAKGLLKSGLVWRVGNGHNIRIEANVWVPNAGSLHINHRVRGQNLVMVANLIDSNTSSWKAELIKSTFSEEDAKKILQIPLVSTTHEDFLAWRGEHTGEYTKDWRTENTPFGTTVKNFSVPYGLSGLLETNGFTKGKNNKEKRKQNLLYTVDHKTNKSCSGIIVRDYKRNEIAIRSTIHENIPSGFEAEAIACLQAVILGRDLGLKFVDIEGDSLTVIKKAKSVKRDKSVLGSYIRDIKEISKFFHKSNFQHIGRSANERAHNLALKGLKTGENAYLDRRSADEEITE
ncbi:hypothetical protein CXB51_010974 [Gossypium anomalum]|uniref:RNase H type-1 domain-containing protein n=1 Tax=Gossypium anomalum TaxID=47600 RepID=A0A8J5Z3B6_9ROSI|nr:hypothetical protein CXB51_010974 [Gossypium anomalum]